ncbi:MAG: hypothetical protein IPJ36_18715 [Simplicispira sp.]|nr:hypothetical protein [Simplicispira sp.]
MTVQLKERVGWQKAVVALAQQNTRIIWAVLAKAEYSTPIMCPSSRGDC